MRGTVYRDFGGNAGGKSLLKKSGLTFVCPDCGGWQYESRLILERRFKPRCAKCGAYMVETKRTRERISGKHQKKGNDRYCITCGARLRSTNYLPYCSPCLAGGHVLPQHVGLLTVDALDRYEHRERDAAAS